MNIKKSVSFATYEVIIVSRNGEPLAYTVVAPDQRAAENAAQDLCCGFDQVESVKLAAVRETA